MRYLIAVMGLFLISCVHVNEYRIDGTIENVKKGEVLLYVENGDSDTEKLRPIAETTVDEDGRFFFNGIMDSVKMGKLVYKDGDENYAAYLFLETGNTTTKLKIQEGSNAYGNEGVIDIIELSGTKNNNILMDYNRKMTDFHETVTKNFKGFELVGKIDELTASENIDTVQLKKLNRRKDSLMTDYFSQMVAVKKDIYTASNGSLAGLYLLTSEGYNVTTSPFFNEEEKREYLRLADEEALNTNYYQILLKTVKLTDEILENGTEAPKFTLKNENGEPVSLEQYRGKYVLLDFWAYYCGPCIKSFPKLRDIYSKYRDQGLEIISISSDLREDRWQNALTKHANPWIQLIDKPSAENNKQGHVSQLYNIPGLPTYCLIDDEGKIVVGSIKDDLVLGKIKEIFETK